MKKLFPIVLAGMFGGLMTWAAIQWFSPEQSTPISDVEFVANHSANESPANDKFPFDFSQAAEVASPSVVLIQAEVSERMANQQQQKRMEESPFSRFFDLFGEGEMDLDFMQPFSWNMIPPPGTGSGVIISEDGYIVTNNHVVEKYDVINVTLQNGETFDAKMIGKDPASDLAVVKIAAKGLPTLKVADSDEAKVGEWVLAIGNPYEELRSTVTAGIISAKGRDINIIKGERNIEEFIQTDAAINPGNSGGALVNADGDLLGINTAIYSRTGSYVGYSFAIPSNLMKQIVTDIIENGDIERVSLGVNVSEIDVDLAQQLDLPVTQGLLIRKVVERSSAQYAGLLPDDIIVEVDGKKIKSFDDLKTKIDYSKVGDILDIKVMRDGELKRIDVRLKDGL